MCVMKVFETMHGVLSVCIKFARLKKYSKLCNVPLWRKIRYIIYTGLFISPSGISELDCATTKTDTAERSISIGRESLQVFFFLY